VRGGDGEVGVGLRDAEARGRWVVCISGWVRRGWLVGEDF
jgi:hypothetical protein